MEDGQTVRPHHPLTLFLFAWLPAHLALVLQRDEFEDTVGEQLSPPRESRRAWVQRHGQCEHGGDLTGELS